MHSYAKRGLGSRYSVRPFVCPSVRPKHALIMTKLHDVLRIFWYRTIGQSLCYLTAVDPRRPLLSEICAQSDASPFKKHQLQRITAYNVSTVRDSGGKVQLWRIGSQPRVFQLAIDRVHTLPLSPPMGGSKSDFFVFWIKVNFSRIKSATKFLCVKNSSGKVVVWPFPYLMVHRYWRET